MITLYGIKNCDTCRKARKWLGAEGIAHRYHDFREDGLDAKDLKSWISAVGWETLLNTRGTTWRNLPNADRENLTPEKAAALMLANPTLIKRPVFDAGGRYFVGFTKTEQDALRRAA